MNETEPTVLDDATRRKIIDVYGHVPPVLEEGLARLVSQKTPARARVLRRTRRQVHR